MIDPRIRGRRRGGAGALAAAVVGALAASAAHAEPYLAARTMSRCSTCHINMTGGGERNSQGRVYAQNTLARAPYEPDAGFPLMTGQVGDFLTLGADLRFSNLTVLPPKREGSATNEFATNEANLYATARVWRDRLYLHVDERLAPGGAQNREAFLLLKLPASGWVKAGRFFPPFGTRLYDDGAFIRTETGYSFQTTDEGVEVGLEPGQSSIVAAVTNGAGGGAENDTSKQASLFFSQLIGAWRIGASASNNVTGGTRTSVGSLFGSVSWKEVVLLAEGDLRFDKTTTPGKSRLVGFIEGDWEMTRGLTLKLSHEYLDPDRDVGTDERTRSGIGLAWFPVGGLELDSRVLYYDGPPQRPGENLWSLLLSAHLFF